MKIPKTYVREKVLPAVIVALLGVVPLLVVGLNRPESMVMENQTTMKLDVTFAFAGVEGVQSNYTRFEKGSIEPGDTITADVYRIRTASYLIEAKDEYQNVVFTGEFSPEKLDEMDWTVVFTE